MADLTMSIGAKDEASPRFRQVAESAKKMGAELDEATQKGARGSESMSVAFFKAQAAFAAVAGGARLAFGFIQQGVQGLIEAEKADLQLAAALRQVGLDAALLTPVFKAQADALEQTTLVEAEHIQQMQQLLLRHGVAPNAINKTVTALLDYAAATGKDGRSATEALVKGLEKGGEEMRALGVTVERTGDKSKDLNAVVDAMAEKFGGAAAAATQGLAGDIGRLKDAQNKLGESFATFIAKVETKTGIIRGLTEALRGATAAIDGNDDIARSERKAELADLIAKHEARRNELLKERASIDPDNEAGLRKNEVKLQHTTRMLQQYRLEQKQIQDAIKEDIDNALKGQQALENAGSTGVATETNEGTGKIVTALKERKRRIEYENEQAFAALKASMSGGILSASDATMEALVAIDENTALLMEAERLSAEDRLAEAEQASRLRIAAIKSWQADEDEMWAQRMGNTRNRIGQLTIATAQAAEAEGGPAMMDAGLAVGNAFISGLDQSLTQMESGGEMDVGAIIASVLPALITAGLIAANPALAPVAPLVGQAAGVLFKHASKQVGSGPSDYDSGRKHNGGWAGEPRRYHSGGVVGSDEVPAILQTGERVLSRREVADMGGREGVDRAARGSGMVIHVSTLDSQSFQEFMGDRGGTGMTRAIQQKRGEFVQRLRRVGVKS